MYDSLIFSNINDFIFCPVSIYFHNLYGYQDTTTYQCKDQILGTQVHSTIDEKKYSSKLSVLQGMMCYCEKYNLIGKIDLFDTETKILTERKRTIKTIYDGYVFQLYAQYFSLTEMGYAVEKIRLYSYTDNKIYEQKLPDDNPEMFNKFEKVLYDIRHFDMSNFVQDNEKKCINCIYSDACDRSLV